MWCVARVTSLVAIKPIKCFETGDTKGKTQIELRGHGSTEKLRCDGLIGQ